ncbi:MAG: hypothetical protein SF187_00710 [Deltaproteobacteria bacterium]|nr:hypothetical protein [Deltaproteobacteria bacterium]
MNAKLWLGSVCALIGLAPHGAWAATYSYVDWTEANVAAGTAKGTITLPDSSTVTVTFEAINANGSAGNLYGAQVNGGTNYWNPTAPYVSAEVENFPPSPDILQLSGGQNQVYKVTLSEAIKDPIMAIVSLGASGTTITYNFDAPFAIVSQGSGYWGGGSTALVQLPNNVLQGTEGHGTVQFLGTFPTFSWTVPTPESWHGFTFGIRTTERLEPPDAGADAGVDANAVDAATSVDAAVAMDALQTTTDASPLSDAGAARDASGDVSGSGTGTGPDAGRPAPEDDGCSCRVGRQPRRSNGALASVVLLLGAAWVRRSRRRGKR